VFFSAAALHTGQRQKRRRTLPARRRRRRQRLPKDSAWPEEAAAGLADDWWCTPSVVAHCVEQKALETDQHAFFT